ncbi:MAG: IPT/TIG domain-containing protein [Bacteroidales bacterium]|nr:IPT/TIG domain-containing protein [Bacteroidales bacterium]
MDLNIRKYIYAFLAFVCVMLSSVSCIFDDDYDTDDFETEALQFRVLAPDTKLTYNDLSTSFENDDVVGCVIASNNGGSYTFQTNTKWKYEDGVLMLDADAAGHIQKWKDPENEEKSRQMSDEGYVQLLGDYNYAFFFYYPYVETLDETYPNKIEWGNTTYLADKLTDGNWTSYPMFVNTDYTDTTPDDGKDQTKLKLNHSDHLWVGYTADNGNPINKENATHPVDLTFKKKTATIEIHCDIADGYSIENVSVSSPSIVRGVKLDLSTGDQTKYTDNANALYDGTITPGLINTTGKERVYRMMLPAQTISEWNLNATLKGGEIAELTEFTLPLEEKLSVLEEGKLYILHIAKAGHGYIIINDWNNGGASDLIEDQTMPENLSLSSTTDRDETEGILVKAGETLVVTGQNLDYAASLRLEGVYKLDDAFYEVADDHSQITITVPPTAKDGDVYLVTSSGIAVSAGTYVLVKPVAIAVSSNSVKPGETTLTITGTDLDLVTRVVFGGDVAADVEVNSEGTSLTVTVPDMAVTGTIAFMLANGTMVPCDGLGEIIVAVPEVTDISASEGKFKAKATITISGSNLDLATGVRIKWGETVMDVEFAKVNASALTFIMPDEALDGSVYVIARSGAEILAGNYTLTVPIVAAENYYNPSVVEAGDDLVITGTDLDLVKTVTFVGSSTPVEPSVKSEASLTVRVPDDGKTGALTLTLLNGTTVTCPVLTFAQPSVTSMTGTREKVDDKPLFKAGDIVTLIGENLHLIKSIKLENAEVTTFIVSDDKKTLTFEMPATAKDGTASYVSKSGDVVTIGVYVLVKPVVTSGSDITVEPREPLTIEGTDLDLVTSIYMNNVGSVSFEYAEGEISVTVPDNASTGTLNLNLANGTSVGIQLTVNKINECSVSTLKGDNDSNGVHEVRENGTITVTGNNLEFAKSVKIVVDGGATHTVEVTDADLADGLSFELPSGVTSDGTIYLVNQYGYKVQAGRYEMAFPTGVSLPSPIKAGTTVTITGTDMDLVSSVKFHNNVTPAEEPVISGTEISVKVPDTAIEGSISLVTKYGKTIDVLYTLVKPVWISYNPAEKAFVGEQLTINGSDMDLVTGVTFAGCSTPVVPDEGTRTELSITVLVPAEAKTGQIYLNLANGTSVACQELTIDYPWCYITDDLNAMEIYSGSTIEVNVANGSALTGVQVNGADVSHTLSESKLSIAIPADAGNNTTLTLISGDKGSVEYTFNCAKVIWSGTANMMNEDIDIVASQSSTIQSGSLIILECTQSPSSNGYVSLKYKSNQQEVLAGYQFPWVGSETERTVIFTITKDISEDIYVDTAVWGGTITLNRIIIK